jgi:seryl-tRNA synthetase
MTADPTIVGGVPWGTIVAVASSSVVVLAGILGMLIKMLYKSHQAQTEQKFETLAGDVVKLDREVRDYFRAHEKLRDKWDEFLKEYLKIDSTRGQKVEALFRIVDQMQDTVRELRPTLNEKMEELLSRALSELKLYVRDLMREESRER